MIEMCIERRALLLLFSFLTIQSTCVSAFLMPASSCRYLTAATATSVSPKPSKLSMAAVSYESLLERLPSQAVIEAVAKQPSNEYVIASDVAAAAGVSLLAASGNSRIDDLRRFQASRPASLGTAVGNLGIAPAVATHSSTTQVQMVTVVHKWLAKRSMQHTITHRRASRGYS